MAFEIDGHLTSTSQDVEQLINRKIIDSTETIPINSDDYVMSINRLNTKLANYYLKTETYNKTEVDTITQPLDDRITTAEANILTNATDIGTNTTNITTLRNDVDNNRIDINTNIVNIGDMGVRLTTNEGNISTLQTDVTALDGRVTTNETAIANTYDKATTDTYWLVNQTPHTGTRFCQ